MKKEVIKSIVSEVKDDFAKRKQERKPFEQTWLLNLNFLMGNQYSGISHRGELEDYAKQYFWQEREVYNHIAPLIETRLAKLTRVRPTMTVLPASGDLDDISMAKVSKNVLTATQARIDMSSLVSEASKWSEICGTAFYKVLWNSEQGALIGRIDDSDVNEGDIEVGVCSPFEIYPDSNSALDVEDCMSIIHARTYHVDVIKNVWGVEVKGESIESYTLEPTSNIGGLGYTASTGKIAKTLKHSSALVLEKYVMPSKAYPNGRLIIVAGDQLVYDGELPYINGENGKRKFPFVRQVAIHNPNLFWGTSIIERCIPVQRAYNAVKNRKHEFLNRISMGVLTVEDGSVDIDNLEEEGLAPGKVLVFRQGSNAPRMLSGDNVPLDFTYEEDRLLSEFTTISGVSELLNGNSTKFANMSGVALQLMLEQEDARISASGESIRFAMLEIARQILRLYKYFATTKRIARFVGKNGEVEQFYWNKSDIVCTDVVFDTETEIGDTVAQRRNMVFDLLNAGLLHDENGKLSNAMRVKVLELLGFGVWDSALDVRELQKKCAEEENLRLVNEGVEPTVIEVHDHNVHVESHTAFMLTKEFATAIKGDSGLTEKMLKHIRKHKRFGAIENEIENKAR